MLRLQQRLRERDDAGASLRHANAVLRAQLEAAHAGNAALAADAERVAREWREFSREEQAKVSLHTLQSRITFRISLNINTVESQINDVVGQRQINR